MTRRCECYSCAGVGVILPAEVCPICSGDREIDEPFADLDPHEDDCPTCKGTGTINALTKTRRQGSFIASYGECPDCDGTGAQT